MSSSSSRVAKATLIHFPIVLSLLLMAAHFLRDAAWIGVGVSLGPLLLLPLRRPWVARTLQVLLLMGALEWVRTLVELANLRAATGQPLVRLVIILGIVAAITAASAWLFQTRTMKRIYRIGQGEG